MGGYYYTGCVVCGIEAGVSSCRSICAHYRDLKESGQGAQLLWLDADELERTYRFREKRDWVDTLRLSPFPFCPSID
jgi:hypothetical protein